MKLCRMILTCNMSHQNLQVSIIYQPPSKLSITEAGCTMKGKSCRGEETTHLQSRRILKTCHVEFVDP